MNTVSITKYFDQALGLDRFNFGLLEAVSSSVQYPRHNIIKVGEDRYRVEVCLPGWDKKNINITRQDKILVISGEMSDKVVNEEEQALHRGISMKAFRKPLAVPENIQIEGPATLENGILTIFLSVVNPQDKSEIEVPIA